MFSSVGWTALTLGQTVRHAASSIVLVQWAARLHYLGKKSIFIATGADDEPTSLAVAASSLINQINQ